jgi:hypothetical protein
MRNYITPIATLVFAVTTAGLCFADVVDRVALIVGKVVFTQTEVDDEARLSELESVTPLDLSPARRKEAAERLVDQQLLRDELRVTGFQPPAADPEAILRRFRQQHFASVVLYRAALARYEVTEEALKQHLLWELTVISFTDRRFRPFATAADTQSANRGEAGADGKVADGSAAQTTDQAMDAWLKQQRAETRVVFKPEAFR